MRLFYVYIMAIGRNGTLYVGLTSDLIKRAWEHKSKVIPGFTARYNAPWFIMRFTILMWKQLGVRSVSKTGVGNGRLT